MGGGAKSLFPIFSRREMLFPGRFPGPPKTKFSGFQKRKKKKKRKKSSAHFHTFVPFNSPSHLQYYFFSSPFHFSLAYLFPVDQQIFPGEKRQGGTLPPAPPVTPLGSQEQHTIQKHTTSPFVETKKVMTPLWDI